MVNMERKVNRTKRAKIGTHGFKVYKNTKVYIGKKTSKKRAVKQSIVNNIITVFNSDPSIRKMVKHIKYISIKHAPSIRWAGQWNENDRKFTFYDCDQKRSDVREVVYHEIVGHAYWWWAKKWRNTEWTVFNKLANKLPPVNDYVSEYESSKIDGRTDTIYENEQHSAITELIMNGTSYHKTDKTNITKKQINELKNKWKLLHY